MNPSPLASITCEFESIDLADLAVSRLLHATENTENIQIHRCRPPKHAPDLNRKQSIPPIFFPGTENFFFRPAKHTVTELHQIRSITTEIRCSQEHVREIAGKLTSLGAAHIRIR